MQPTNTPSDASREAFIAYCEAMVIKAKCATAKRFWFDRMAEEIRARSPQVVAAMEKAKCLR